jgi:hypothetical protein
MNKISKEMLNELNAEYNDAIFEFVFQDDDENVVDIKMKRNCQKYIDSYIINLEDDTRNNIRNFFRKKNVNIRYNNTASCFWAAQMREA